MSSTVVQCIRRKLISWRTRANSVFSLQEPVPQGPSPLQIALAKLAEQSSELGRLADKWKAMDEQHKREREDALTIQDLLDDEARLSNELLAVRTMIRQRRLPQAPSCFGLDDCSTQALSTCPYRMDCGS